jgi:hypothetical protein
MSAVDRSLLVRSSARAVRLAGLANVAFGTAVVLGFVLSFAMGVHFTALLLGAEAGADMLERTVGLRWTLLLGFAMAVAIHVLLEALGRLVATVYEGDPFVADNAVRLQRIGWSLLALQLLDAPAALIGRAYPALGNAAPYADLSPAGWLAGLMAFVLARVFAAGSRMREDLAGTV